MIAAIFNPATILLATLCVHWVAFGSSGPLAIKLPYLALGLVILFAASGPRKLAACAKFVRDNALWLVPFAVYLALTSIVLRGSPVEGMAPRQIFFLVGTVAFAGCIATSRRLPHIFRIGAVVGLAVFVAAMELLARKIGLSWADAVSRFLAGDFNFVMFSFFRGVFNALDPTGDVTLSASTKNATAVSLLVLALLFRGGSANPPRDIAGIAFLGFAMALLIMLNTRSVLIVAGLSMVMATGIGALIRPVHNFPLFVLKFGALLLILITIVMILPTEGASDALSTRFTFDDYSAASRVEQFQLALAQIEKEPVTGTGYFEVDGHVIHNLFLAAWVHAGIGAFVLVVLFYVALIARWVMLIAAVAARPDRWVIPIAFEWIAPLPILPLFRVWLSGDAGHPFLGEWIAVGAFLGCVVANDLMRRRLAGLQLAANGQGVSPAPHTSRPVPASRQHAAKRHTAPAADAGHRLWRGADR
ncbi:hypothetical protein [Sphingomonas sp.]|uniref:hypothetical protein n=1 Tax=Sphingomonas sp. TaxID=28214 RepID=UPI00286E4135|nr:hypothetical protein [Sphingomonas sp.]